MPCKVAFSPSFPRGVVFGGVRVRRKKTQATPEASDASGDERLEPEATSFFSSIHLYRIPFLSGISNPSKSERQRRLGFLSVDAREEEEKKRKRKSDKKEEHLLRIVFVWIFFFNFFFRSQGDALPSLPLRPVVAGCRGVKKSCTAAPGGGCYIFHIL